MVVADLHVHTTNSDGTLTLAEVPIAARAGGIDAVAITDHDRIHPQLHAPISTIDGVELIHGIELRVETATERVDLLGYGLQRTETLESLVSELQANRIERARSIVGCVEDRLDVELEIAFEPGVGRPHIARAIEESDVPFDYEAAFAELIGDDCPCYVSRDIPSVETGLRCLQDSCALVGLAHPFRYDKPAVALELAPKLDAIELHYPYSHTVDTSVIMDVARDHQLVLTGGSDAHDDRLGVTGLSKSEYEAVRSRLTE